MVRSFGFLILYLGLQACLYHGSRSSESKINFELQTISEDGQPLVAKITIKGRDGTSDPNIANLAPNAPFGPETGERRNVAFSKDGRLTLSPPIGSYDVYISKGGENLICL